MDPLEWISGEKTAVIFALEDEDNFLENWVWLQRGWQRLKDSEERGGGLKLAAPGPVRAVLHPCQIKR